MQHARGFIVGCTNRVTLISWEAEHTEEQIGQAFYRQKPYYQHITYGYKVIGYMFAKQSYWYKLRGLLFKLKAILLVQTGRGLLFKLRRPRAFQLSLGLLLGAY